jgi:hypothetical protein
MKILLAVGNSVYELNPRLPEEGVEVLMAQHDAYHFKSNALTLQHRPISILSTSLFYV